MIYVPSLDYACYVVNSEGVIRAYETMPQNGITTNYRDYYIKSNYIYKDGYTSWSNYSTLPVCLDRDVLTTDFYYRNDLDSILIVFLIICIFGLFLPLKIFSKLFKKGGF